MIRPFPRDGVSADETPIEMTDPSSTITLDDFRTRTNETVVLDDGRWPARLQHATDTDATGQAPLPIRRADEDRCRPWYRVDIAPMLT
jgi:hypothetical protein